MTESIKKNLDGCDLIICLNCYRAHKTKYERMNYGNKFIKYTSDEGLMYLV